MQQVMLLHVRLWKMSKQGRGKAARQRIEKQGNPMLVQRFDSLQTAVNVDEQHEESPGKNGDSPAQPDDLNLSPQLIARTTPNLPMSVVKAKKKPTSHPKAAPTAAPTAASTAAPAAPEPVHGHVGQISEEDRESGFTIEGGQSYASLQWAGGTIYSKPHQKKFRIWRSTTHTLGKLDADVPYKIRSRAEALEAAKVRIQQPGPKASPKGSPPKTAHPKARPKASPKEHHEGHSWQQPVTSKWAVSCKNVMLVIELVGSCEMTENRDPEGHQLDLNPYQRLYGSPGRSSPPRSTPPSRSSASPTYPVTDSEEPTDESETEPRKSVKRFKKIEKKFAKVEKAHQQRLRRL
jgi:hypothetical protein